jgi:outer membrane protein assembly factor BamB
MLDFVLVDVLETGLRVWHTEVAARVDSKSNFGSVVVGIRSSLCAAKGTGLVGTADVELVIVASECC